MSDTSLLFQDIAGTVRNSCTLSEEDDSIYCEKEKIVELLRFCKNKTPYVFLADLTAMERPDSFIAVYQLMRMDNAGIARIKVKLSKENPDVPSVVSVWKAADVQEREIYDMFGITISGHPDLKRILCPDDFVGFPLRKNFNTEPVKRF